MELKFSLYRIDYQERYYWVYSVTHAFLQMVGDCFHISFISMPLFPPRGGGGGGRDFMFILICANPKSKKWNLLLYLFLTTVFVHFLCVVDHADFHCYIFSILTATFLSLTSLLSIFESFVWQLLAFSSVLQVVPPNIMLVYSFHLSYLCHNNFLIIYTQLFFIFLL